MLQRLRKWFKGKRGFTLIEVMIFIAIFSTLAVIIIIIPNYLAYKERHKKEQVTDKAAITQEYKQKTNPKAPEPQPLVVPGKKSGEMRKL